MKRLLLLFVLLSSCRADKASETEVADSVTLDTTKILRLENSETMTDLNVPVDTHTIRLVDNEISADPFLKDFDSMMKGVGKADIQSKLYENQHTENQIDTVLIATFDHSTITYYKEGSEGFIISATIRSNKIEFKRGIEVGMNKVDFLRLFQDSTHIHDFNDVTISDEDSLQSVKFEFDDTQLRTVTFEGFFD